MDPNPSPHEPPVCVVVTGGERIDPRVLAHVPPGACVIGVDSGVAHAVALGLHVDVAVGDFDSLPPQALSAVADAGAVVERHPTAKEATDLELGLRAALARGARRAVVLGGHGGRLDHFLANALLLAASPFVDLAVEAHMGRATLTVARPGPATTVTGRPGDTVSLLPAGGPATGVTTSGLTFPLRGEELRPGTTRGVSNELTATSATVALDGGALLVVLPGRIPS